MSRERELLEEEREQALRDLLALDEQVAAGEIPPDAAERLRAEYERTAADAMTRLDQERPTGPRKLDRRSRARTLAYLATVLVAGIAALVILPNAVQQRPQNGFVTGNEPMQSTSSMPMPTPSLPTDADAAATALWIQANVEMFQQNDPAAALHTLSQLQQRPGLSDSARQDIAALIATAQRELGKAGR